MISTMTDTDSKKILPQILAILKEIVVCARTGRYSDAASKMNTGIQQIQPVLLSGKIAAEDLKKLTYSLETVLILQKQSDWVAVADVLEYEFSDLLKQAIVPLDQK